MLVQEVRAIVDLILIQLADESKMNFSRCFSPCNLLGAPLWNFSALRACHEHTFVHGGEPMINIAFFCCFANFLARLERASLVKSQHTPLSSVEQLSLSVLGQVLMGTSSAPLRKRLTDSGLGSAVIGGGLDDELQQA